MPYLGDFVGVILSEMARARAMSDATSIELADAYAAHELLKHLAVPRFRLGEVRFDLPVIVEDDIPSTPPIDKLTAAKARSLFDSAWQRRVLAADVAVPQSIQRVVNRQVTAYLKAAFSTRPRASSVTLADGIAKAAIRAATAERPALGDAVRQHQEPLRADLIRELVLERGGDIRLRVLSTTSSVSEVDDIERLVRIQLTVTEDALEWTMVPDDDGEKPRLVAE